MNKLLSLLGIGQINEDQEPTVEPISTKRFLFMSLVGIGLIVVLKGVFA